MRPSASQTPPYGSTSSASDAVAPLSRFVRLTVPPEKKPTDCPSGEKNGAYAPSVPGSAATAGASIRRWYKRVAPALCPTNTRVMPSGDTTNAGVPMPNGVEPTYAIAVLSGTTMDVSYTGRVSSTGTLAARRHAQAATRLMASVVPARTAAAQRAEPRP